jgi:hypothetical protein
MIDSEYAGGSGATKPHFVERLGDDLKCFPLHTHKSENDGIGHGKVSVSTPIKEYIIVPNKVILCTISIGSTET